MDTRSRLVRGSAAMALAVGLLTMSSVAPAYAKPKGPEGNQPTVPGDMVTFLETVILHEDDNAHANAERVAAQIDQIDYVRLNMEATA